MLISIVTAAGESKRFPWNKLLYKYHDKPIIVKTVENLLDSGFIDKVVVVTGYMHNKVEAVLREYGLNVDTVYNPDYSAGMSTSIKKGVEYVLHRGIEPDGVLVNPGDCAWIHPGIVALVAVKFYEYRDMYNIVVASYHGRRGHPVVFSRRIIPEIPGITEEKHGLKELMVKYANETLLVETNYPGVILDLDTILDLLRVKSTILL